MVTRGRKSKGGHQAGSCSSGESQASGDAPQSGKEGEDMRDIMEG